MTVNRAFRIHAHGGPHVLQADDLPVPEPKAGEALVVMKAAGVNQLDWKFREGLVRGFSLPLPVTLGVEFAGVVAATGDAAGGFQAGDRVMGFLHGLGAYTDHLQVSTELLARIPTGLSDPAAAALPIPLTTAWQSLHAAGEPHRGARILVHGGAGAVGSMAVQLAKAAGAFVITTTSRANLDYVAGLGADQGLDYGAGPFEQRVNDIDLVLDFVGGQTLERSWGILAAGGAIVSAAQFDVVERAPPGIRAFWVMAQPDVTLLERLAAMVAGGTIRSTVGEVFASANIKTAIESTRQRRPPGKAVIDFTR